MYIYIYIYVYIYIYICIYTYIYIYICITPDPCHLSGPEMISNAVFQQASDGFVFFFFLFPLNDV